jgi:hypothetical protein
MSFLKKKKSRLIENKENFAAVPASDLAATANHARGADRRMEQISSRQPVARTAALRRARPCRRFSGIWHGTQFRRVQIKAK